MLSVPCHPVGSEGYTRGDRTTGLRAHSEPGASVLPLAASFSTGARWRDAPCGRLSTWRQASPPPGARHHLHLAPIRPGDIIQGARGKTPARGVSTFHVRPSPRNVETPLAGVFLLVRPPAPGFEGQHGENGQTGLRIGKYNNAQRREICYTLLNGSVDEPLWLLDTRKKDDSMSENTYVAPTENAAEMARLIDQDRLVTEAMGGLFPPDLDPQAVRAVLDV